MSNKLDQIFSTNYQKVLKFLATSQEKEYTEKEIQEVTQVSKAGVNFALRDLAKDGLANIQKRGRMSFYSVSSDNPLISQIKVIINLINIEPLVHSLKNYSDKIILFGSNAKGTNTPESDIDLFVLTNNTKDILNIANKSQIAENIQLITKKPIEYVTMKKNDAVFYNEVSSGLLIYEKKK